MSYRAPINDMTFLLENVVDYNLLENSDYFEDSSLETTVAILNEASRMAEMELNPLQSIGDQQPAYLENGVVRTAPGFSEGYKAIMRLVAVFPRARAQISVNAPHINQGKWI